LNFFPLRIPSIVIDDDVEDGDDGDLMKPVFQVAITDESPPETALKLFQSEVVQDGPFKQRFSVCRIDGVLELRKEIMGIYKNPKTNLKLVPRIRFEEEEGMGSGPLREFCAETIRVIDEGIPSHTGKPLMFLEGPINRLTGAYKAMGRIIGHSILHGGSGVHGLSPAFKHYLSNNRDSETPPPMTVEDIPDIELRQVMTEVSYIYTK
jgi:hypothetical protein